MIDMYILLDEYDNTQSTRILFHLVFTRSFASNYTDDDDVDDDQSSVCFIDLAQRHILSG